MSGEYEILDIEEVIARWDEIMDRTEAGESFAISVKGEPKAMLRSFEPGQTLFVSFWTIGLANLPEGDFTHRRIPAADARQRIEEARKRNALLCVSADDLLAPYRKQACDDHRALCRVLQEHHGIELSLKEFVTNSGSDGDPLYTANPLELARIGTYHEMLIVSCAYSAKPALEAGKPVHEIESDTVSFHLFSTQETAVQDVQAFFADIRPAAGLLSDELIRERREEAKGDPIATAEAMTGQDSGLIGSMRDSAELLDEIVADAMIDRQIQAWRPSRKDFAALEAFAAGTGCSLPDLLNEALRDFLSRHGEQPGPRDRSETSG